MAKEVIIPLFPLGVVLLPEMPMPLHIFEPRYKKMIGECLDENKPFGIVYYSGNKIRSVGCSARIVEVLKRVQLDDKLVMKCFHDLEVESSEDAD